MRPKQEIWETAQHFEQHLDFVGRLRLHWTRRPVLVRALLPASLKSFIYKGASNLLSDPYVGIREEDLFYTSREVQSRVTAVNMSLIARCRFRHRLTSWLTALADRARFDSMPLDQLTGRLTSLQAYSAL